MKLSWFSSLSAKIEQPFTLLDQLKSEQLVPGSFQTFWETLMSVVASMPFCLDETWLRWLLNCYSDEHMKQIHSNSPILLSNHMFCSEWMWPPRQTFSPVPGDWIYRSVKLKTKNESAQKGVTCFAEELWKFTSYLVRPCCFATLPLRLWEMWLSLLQHNFIP